MDNITHRIYPLELLKPMISLFLQERMNISFEKEQSHRSRKTITKLDLLQADLKHGLWALVEYPYVDKVYRSSYYAYYATKHRDYGRNSMRVSIFEGEIHEEDFRDPTRRENLQNLYLGFFTIRPTQPNFLGRSMISPRAMRRAPGAICTADEASNINGASLKVSAFPHCSQDTETMTCAETTVWAVMEYLGRSHPEFRPVTPADINRAVSKIAYQRTWPSTGLSAVQISYAFKEFDLDSKVYADPTYTQDELRQILSSYLDSRMPIVLVMKNQRLAHAVVAVGKESRNGTPPGLREWAALGQRMAGARVLEARRLPYRYIAVDDNYPPYQTADFRRPTQYYGEDSDFRGCRVNALVVPLLKKIYMDAVRAQEMTACLLDTLKKEARWGANRLILRVFCERSSVYKDYIARNLELAHNWREAILQTPMPRHIWVAEVGTPEELYATPSRIRGVIMLDATEADRDPLDSMLFFLSPKTVLRTKGRRQEAFQAAVHPFAGYNPAELGRY